MTTTYTSTTIIHGPALQKMLEAFPQAHEVNDGWWRHDDNPRFDFREQENGSIYIHPWTGRSVDEILTSVGLSLADITPKGHFKVKVRDTLDLTELGQAKKIDPRFLANLGLQDGYKFKGRNCVKIPYYLQDGSQHTRIRVRKAISGDYKHAWDSSAHTEDDKDTPGRNFPYGLDKLPMARQAGFLPIGEGETDGWASWYHDIPYLGIPGATSHNCLQGIDLNDIPEIYILQEPDQVRKLLSAGEGFYRNVHKALRANGYTGEIYYVDFEKATGCKDASELHIKLWPQDQAKDFKSIVMRALEQAVPANDEDIKPLDLSDIESAIDTVNVEALKETIPQLAQLSQVDYLSYEIKIKKAFGKDINLNTFRAAVNEVRKKLTTSTSRALDLDYVAQVFADTHGDTWAYDTKRLCWREWNGKYWAELFSPESERLTLDNIFTDLVHGLGQEVNRNSSLDCIHRRARGKCKRDFIPRKGLINFRNGTLEIDLKTHSTSTFRAHEKEDGLQYCLDYDYEAGSFPRIQQFMNHSLPDLHAQQAYMATLGLALLRDTTMQYYLFLYGVPNAGKSTYLMLGNAVCGHTLSDYSSFTGDKLFQSDLEGSRERYTFITRRIVCADELKPETFKDNEGLIKTMTAHKGVPVRGMHRSGEEDNQWVPKIMMTANELPHYKDTSGGLKRRTLFLYFPHAIPEHEQDPTMFATFLEELGPFAYSCIALALAVLKRHYYPKSIQMKKTSKEASTSGNALKAFIEDYCILQRDQEKGFDEKDYITLTGVIHQAYKAYCEEFEHKVCSAATMTSALKEMNIGVTSSDKIKRIPGYQKPGRVLYGIRLRQEQDLVEVEDDPVYASLNIADVPLAPCNEFVTTCNDLVTTKIEDRYASNMALQADTLKNCNDVTTKTTFSASSKVSAKEETASIDPIKVQGAATRENISGLVVTSLQNGANPPVEHDEACNDGAKTPLFAVTPSLQILPPKIKALCERVNQHLGNSKHVNWHGNRPGAPEGYWPDCSLSISSFWERIEALLTSGDVRERDLAIGVLQGILRGGNR